MEMGTVVPFAGSSFGTRLHIRRGRSAHGNERSLASQTDYPLPRFVSTASAAKSFRSRCGSVRGAPECSSQTSPTAAPQVVQGTDSICFGVSSLDFTLE